MNGLEHELQALAPLVEWPDPPDLTRTVTTLIATPERRRRPSRALVVVLAAVVLAVAVAFAVPPARSAILDWLGIGSARIERVETLPPLTPAVPLDVLGEPVTLAEARSRAGFAFVGPPRDEQAPDEVRVVDDRRVSYVWRDGARVRLLITQVPEQLQVPAIHKLVPPEVKIEDLTIDGHPAAWLEGGPHAVALFGPDGFHEEPGWLAGNTLVVDRGTTTLRLEGDLDLQDAIDLVRAMSG